jgi:hypothetical protein
MGVVAAVPGCVEPAAFPSALFTVDATTADYPVMLSRTSVSEGRPIEAASGTHWIASSSSYTSGKSTITVTHVSENNSELSASVKLAAQVQRSDRWVSLKRTTWYARDFSHLGGGSSDHELRIEATAHR